MMQMECYTVRYNKVLWEKKDTRLHIHHILNFVKSSYMYVYVCIYMYVVNMTYICMYFLEHDNGKYVYLTVMDVF